LPDWRVVVTTTILGVGFGAATTAAWGGAVWPGVSWTYRVTCLTGSVAASAMTVDTLAGPAVTVGRTLGRRPAEIALTDARPTNPIMSRIGFGSGRARDGTGMGRGADGRGADGRGAAGRGAAGRGAIGRVGSDEPMP
jgi:hypothetical protein